MAENGGLSQRQQRRQRGLAYLIAPIRSGRDILGDPTDMAQRLQDQSGRLPATRCAATDADVGAAAQKLGLRSGLRRDCLGESKCHALRRERGGCLYCGARQAGAGALRESTHSTEWVLRLHEAALQQVEDFTS